MYLLPTGNEGGVFDLECGSEAKPPVVYGSEELYVVIRCEFCVQPLFVQCHSNGVEVGGGPLVESDGAGGEGGVACRGGTPEGLGYVGGESLCL